MNMKKLMLDSKKQRYAICILMAIVFCLLFVFKDSTYAEYIASDVGQTIELRSGSQLTQTWLSDKKKICGMNLVFAQKPEIDGYLSLEVIDKVNGSVVRSAGENLSQISDGVLILSFKTLNIKSSTQYVFQIKFEQADGTVPGSIALKTNSNYSGLCIDGVEQNCGLASGVLYVKSSGIFTVVFFAGSILIFAFCFMHIFKREFTDVIGMVIIAMAICLYLCGLLISVEVGAILIEILTIAGFVFVLYNIAAGKLEIKKIFSWGVLALGLFYVFSILYNYNTIIAESDEFYHWALVAKDMFYSNQLPSHEGTTVVFTRYPPFMALIQYYFMYINQTFSVKWLYIAYQFSGFCFLMVCMGRRLSQKKMSIYRKILITIILVMFPLILYRRYYNLIMIDGFLGILFSYVLYCYFFDELDRFNMVRITMALTALVLTKEMGVVLAGLACAAFMICKLIEKGKFCLKDELKIIIMGLIALGTFISWQLYCYFNLSVVAEKNLASATQMLSNGSAKLADSNGIQYAISVLINGITCIFNDIKVGPFHFVLVLCVLMVIAYCVRRRKDQEYHFAAVIVLSIGGLIYFGCMMMLYILVFPSSTALSAASLGRYLFSYLMGMLYLEMSYFLNKDSKILGVILCLVLYLAPLTEVLSPNQMIEKRQTIIWGYDEIDANIRSFAGKEDRIFYLCDNSTQMSYRIFRFYICPISAQGIDAGCDFGYTSAGGDTYDIEEIKRVLSDYDYVYIANYEETAKDEYLKLFDDETDLMTGGIYRVDMRGDDLRLLYMGYSPIMRFY